MTTRAGAAIHTLAAFAQARWLMRRLQTREQLLAYQSRKLSTFLSRIAPRVAVYRDLPGRRLEDYPVTDKARLMADFAAYNTLSLDAVAAWSAFATGEPPQTDFAVGASTGTSGNRGLYVVADRERFTWLGVILSRAVPDVLSARHRVAIVLPATSRLYDAANESSRMTLRFFPLTEGIEAQRAPLEAFNPSILVAPPKVLRMLAEKEAAIRPQRVFSAAEVLDAADRAIIETYFGVILREIYMATEGLFGVSCEYGTLHLIEDHVAFEWEPAEGSNGLVVPLVTDFTRRTQIMIRYRMNDLLEMAGDPCACGSPHQAVRAVHGRADDVFRLRSPAGDTISITPDVMRNAVLGASRRIDDFRIVQTGGNSVEFELPGHCASEVSAVHRALSNLFAQAGAEVQVSGTVHDLTASGERKLRRVRREWTEGKS